MLAGRTEQGSPPRLREPAEHILDCRRRERAGRGYMRPLPVWNTGCLCGNEYCRLCRSKTIRPAQRCQHGSMTEPFVLKMLQVSGKAEARSAVHTLLAAALRDRMPNRDSARRGSATPPLPVQPQLTCGVRLRWRRESCGPEHRGRQILSGTKRSERNH